MTSNRDIDWANAKAEYIPFHVPLPQPAGMRFGWSTTNAPFQRQQPNELAQIPAEMSAEPGSVYWDKDGVPLLGSRWKDVSGAVYVIVDVLPDTCADLAERRVGVRKDGMSGTFSYVAKRFGKSFGDVGFFVPHDELPGGNINLRQYASREYGMNVPIGKDWVRHDFAALSNKPLPGQEVILLTGQRDPRENGAYVVSPANLAAEAPDERLNWGEWNARRQAEAQFGPAAPAREAAACPVEVGSWWQESVSGRVAKATAIDARFVGSKVTAGYARLVQENGAYVGWVTLDLFGQGRAWVPLDLTIVTSVALRSERLRIDKEKGAIARAAMEEGAPAWLVTAAGFRDHAAWRQLVVKMAEEEPTSAETLREELAEMRAYKPDSAMAGVCKTEVGIKAATKCQCLGCLENAR